MTPAGLPHSEIRGSKDACSSPRLIAACHVLLRLPVPRHPPCALTALDQNPPQQSQDPAHLLVFQLPLVLASYLSRRSPLPELSKNKLQQPHERSWFTSFNPECLVLFERVRLLRDFQRLRSVLANVSSAYSSSPERR